MGVTAPKLIVCGTGPMEDWCKSFLKENSDCNIEMRGFVPNKEAKNLIANSKALILPTQWYEGFPMTIVEAFSVGTPVICSDLGNTGSVIEDNINGVKFQYNSAESLVQVVDQFEQMPREKLGKHAYMKYKNNYAQDKNYEILNKIYMSVSNRGTLVDSSLL